MGLSVSPLFLSGAFAAIFALAALILLPGPYPTKQTFATY